MKRCSWAGDDPLMVAYHDHEWGVPAYEDEVLFEFLILEGAQAGLSWSTILRKRENYRVAFQFFDPRVVASYKKADVDRLMKEKAIVANRQKITGAVTNAKQLLKVQKEFGTFSQYIWSFVKNKPIKNTFKSMNDVPAETKESRAMSKDLKKRGFKFVGPTICYAFMQAVGMVNDHTMDCYRCKEI